jgi:hypothetical protein
VDSSAFDLSVNTMPAIAGPVTIPLRTLVKVSGSYTLSADTSAFPASLFCFVIEDRAAGVYHILRTSDEIVFSIEDTTQSPRFFLRLIPQPEYEASRASCGGIPDGLAIVKAKGPGPFAYQWYDRKGGLLRQVQSASSSDTIYHLPAGNYSVYVTQNTFGCNALQPISIEEADAPIAAFKISAQTIYVNDSVQLVNMSVNANAIFWDLGETTNDGAEKIWKRYNDPGTYTIGLKAQQGACIDSSTVTIDVHALLIDKIIVEAMSERLRIFPNPGNGKFTLLVPDEAVGGRFRVMDAWGRQIKLIRVNDVATEIELYGEKKGIYYYEYRHADGPLSAGKLVVQ